tara:strand:- start:3546 stop:3716 length:171 start_codon:yes stop_codon:yes gene_type:complete
MPGKIKRRFTCSCDKQYIRPDAYFCDANSDQPDACQPALYEMPGRIKVFVLVKNKR